MGGNLKFFFRKKDYFTDDRFLLIFFLYDNVWKNWNLLEEKKKLYFDKLLLFYMYKISKTKKNKIVLEEIDYFTFFGKFLLIFISMLVCGKKKMRIKDYLKFW